MDGDDRGLPVAARGDGWVVVDKPSGLLSVPGKGEAKQDCVASRVRAMHPGCDGPLIVHRLDMDTSGLIVLGLTAEAQRRLSAAFESRRISKRYTALVAGIVAGDEGEVNLPLRVDLSARPYQIVDGFAGRHALTRWRVSAREVDRTRLVLEPVTGRAHQLRVHCATSAAAGGLGHGILGDVLYGSGYSSPAHVGERHAAARLMLHATALEFDAPLGGGRVRVESAPEF